MIDLDKDNLGEIIENNKTVLVQYGATWCGHCRMLKPKLKNLSQENEGIQFVYVDAEKFPESRNFAKVQNLPTFALFKDGKLVNQKQGNKIEVVKELVDEATGN